MLRLEKAPMAKAKNKKVWFWVVKEAVLKCKTGILALQKCLFCFIQKRLGYFCQSTPFDEGSS